ncbi:hypothetical protein COO03_11780 [Bacillus sp. AFS098217]|nr:hypothetical protein COO03_11780 [Bacillus sp. AFS098217]PEU20366.1 hypothetical protein CN525_04545 [Bacillus sp. AFS014408]PFW65309.1 hypothetical protein COL20_01275 [Bacillus sp. AFS075034]
MWSSLILDTVIKVTFVGAGVAVIYAALKSSKTESKKNNYSVTIDAPNLTKDEKEKIAERVLKGMKQQWSK